jgi:membrane protease YdiL (CAAX protease family)
VTYFSEPPNPAAAPAADVPPAPVDAVDHPVPAAATAAALPPSTWPAPRWKSLAFWAALAQVAAVCGVPTQIFLAVLLFLYGMQPYENGTVSLEFFATLSLFDTALVALLIRVFLIFSREHSRDIFIGRKPVIREILIGLVLVLPVLIALTLIVLGIRAVAPWMHTVQESPLEGFMRTPLDATIFLVVVVLAGGIREELQRAFILHRFRQMLRGLRFARALFIGGLLLWSAIFGLLHFDQGWDVAAAVGLLGLFWGVLYVKRRSAVMPMVNHAGFNAAQVAQQLVARSIGL